MTEFLTLGALTLLVLFTITYCLRKRFRGQAYFHYMPAFIVFFLSLTGIAAGIFVVSGFSGMGMMFISLPINLASVIILLFSIVIDFVHLLKQPQKKMLTK
ncbi:hypothetical protein [Priestia koreensis]|uniref:hypothetical protein n=1 Tax=Priestia koreensis TaxID=284581 RepID=UPI00345A3231